MPDRVILTQISSRTWEHPADRAALETLRALPGFDDAVRKVMGYLGERGVRQLFLSNAVRVGPRQRPALHALYGEVLRTLDAPAEWELYVTQTPFANAAAVGFDRPFIVLKSGLFDVLDREQQRNVLAHEVGHIMSGHATYTTIALLLIAIGLRGLPIMAGVALLPFELALLEWYRKAEFSADRAALLGAQDVDEAMRTFMRFAGGKPESGEESLEAFMEQAAEYEGQEALVDRVWHVINTAFRTHPMGTVRAAELQRWVRSGAYDRILAGDYTRRADEAPPLGQEYRQAADYYGQRAKEAADILSGSLARARDAFASAFRDSRGDAGGGGTPSA